ncbi:MAG TPA: M23 family metallopeptidase [Anaerolineales bacterium]|nr:M23 family metallopeptidase [Anaerolineales bacterium]
MTLRPRAKREPKVSAGGSSQTPTHPTPDKAGLLISAGAWLVALSLALLAVYLGYRWLGQPPVGQRLAQAAPQETTTAEPAPGAVYTSTLRQAAWDLSGNVDGIPRLISPHTVVPSRPRFEVKDYVVEAGDSVFEIADQFNLTPESVLWANYEQLDDNPHEISVGMALKIPPVNGVYYQWQEGDTAQGVAARFEADFEDLLAFPGNNFDLIDPEKDPGEWVMVPGGKREFRQWIIPTIARGQAGVSKALYGGGACEGGYEGAYGSGAFIWPAGNHTLSGNDYWSGHLAIDIAAGEGAPVYAADAGVIVFSGTATGGYGNMIVIDHGNGYQTLYAHLSSTAASCGRSVSAGTTVGYAGSTGNSTGPHLHFEVRFQGGFVNPWFVLPAP